MPRISSPPPKVAPAATARTAAKPKPASAEAPTTRAAWGAKPAAKPKKPALAALDGTMHTPSTKPAGKANVADSIAGVKVKSATVSEFTGLTSGNPLKSRTTEVGFGTLTRPQFDALSAEFGGKSAVKYDAARKYTAIDFLPPALQALANKDLDTGKMIELPGTKKLGGDLVQGGELVSIGATPNCHGTAWEAMRQYQGPNAHVQLAYGDAQHADARYSADFSTLATAKPGESIDTSKMKPGDVLTFSKHDAQMGDMELLHSAVYVGGGLYFEKPDTESDEYGESPYRLVTLDQVKAPIEEFLGEKPSATARRPKAALAPTAEAYTAGADDIGKLEKILNKRGETVGRPLTIELIMGIGGGVRGIAFNAVVTKRLETDAEGRGVIR